MYYLCFIYVLSMFYLKTGTEGEQKGYKRGTKKDPDRNENKSGRKVVERPENKSCHRLQ